MAPQPPMRTTDQLHLLSQPIELLLEQIYKEELEQKFQNTLTVEVPKTHEHHLWIKKYEPSRFNELLSHDRINREVACWLKAWEPLVFRTKTEEEFRPP